MHGDVWFRVLRVLSEKKLYSDQVRKLTEARALRNPYEVCVESAVGSLIRSCREMWRGWGSKAYRLHRTPQGLSHRPLQ